MYSVSVNKDRLLHTLRSNLEKHVKEYKEASEKYPKIVMQELRKRATLIEGGSKVDLRFDLPEPRSFETEYEDAIQMLQWSQDDVVVLDQQQFKQYVQDEWHWQKAFAASTQMYNVR